ncbi:hypothetical protein [Stackebrandtia soli]|uniref:hypothetical protein n=1 Tax=Stackebrandtia soli TaxID=1892856 RepID=UPI0039EA1274
MGIADYERLLARLDEAISGPDATSRQDEHAIAVAEMEARLLQQQADLMHAASRLKLPAPRLGADATDESEPADPADELRAAGVAADDADNALVRADHRARRPALLPDSRPRVRNGAVYALCAVAAALPQGIVLTRMGMPTATAPVFVLIPVLAFLSGLILVGPAGTARLRPSRSGRRLPLRRDAKLGAVICGVIGLACGAAWLSLL